MSKIRFDVLTLFPNFFDSPLSTSLLKKAIEKKLVEINIHDIRNFGVGSHKSVDDRPFGGGPGIVLRADVVGKTLENVLAQKNLKNPHIIMMDPTGEKLTQEKAKKLAEKKEIILVAGHYEGVDERFKESYVDEEISIGDYILSSGEVAALTFIDCVSRLIPGFVGKAESIISESFSQVLVDGKKRKLLDYPVYTRPDTFKDKRVPEILLSGNHQQIGEWRRKKAFEKTKKKRPDLLAD